MTQQVVNQHVYVRDSGIAITIHVATRERSDGPAAEAYRHIQELLDFYNKDYYNP